MADFNDLKNLPPQEIEAERCLLGACLIEPAVIGSAEVRPEDFYKDAHRDIFAAMQILHGKGDEVDLVTLTPHWKESKYYETCGGISYIAGLVADVPTAANFRAHERMVIKAAQRRAIIRAWGRFAEKAYGLEEPDEIISDSIRMLNDIRRMKYGEITPYSEVISSGFTSIEKRCETPGSLTGIPTGFAGIDRMTNGWQPGWKYTIAGRPGMGKTAFAMQATKTAAAADFPVGIVSLEMTKEQLGLRDIARESTVPISRLLAGSVHDADWDRLSISAGMLHGLPIWCAFTVFDGHQESRIIDDMVQRLGVKLIIIDYLQLQRFSGHQGNREQEVSALSAMHKRKAKEHNVPVIELSQLNRKVEERQSRKPTLADLRESGSIEQDADFVGFVYREECKCPKTVECLCGNRHRAWFSGAKGRMNEIGDVELSWQGKITRFGDMESGS